MTTVPQGAGRAPTTASGSYRITRTGCDQSWSAPMTDMQPERAEAPFAVTPEPAWKTFAVGLCFALVAAVLVFVL